MFDTKNLFACTQVKQTTEDILYEYSKYCA